jgi:hypothetical protein
MATVVGTGLFLRAFLIMVICEGLRAKAIFVLEFLYHKSTAKTRKGEGIFGMDSLKLS